MHTSTPVEIKRGMVDRFGGAVDPVTLNTVAEIAPIFRRNALNIMFAMREALAQRDRDRLRLAAHTMKGTSGNLGLLRLANMCQAVEDLAEEDAFAAAALELRNIAAEFRQVQQVLEELDCDERRGHFFQGIEQTEYL
ncbi:MAG TPA: Hpt domain-containing protein [Candidatus Sulfomarinibacteraceae bacterium]|nr:Hpt domain-containing protein [Candidatus Sulfomarinibacteraceae bacterium]